MKKIVLDANLIKKYHQDIVYNYSEYPTLDHWNTEYRDIDYKKSLLKFPFCSTKLNLLENLSYLFINLI